MVSVDLALDKNEDDETSTAEEYLEDLTVTTDTRNVGRMSGTFIYLFVVDLVVLLVGKFW